MGVLRFEPDNTRWASVSSLRVFVRSLRLYKPWFKDLPKLTRHFVFFYCSYIHFNKSFAASLILLTVGFLALGHWFETVMFLVAHKTPTSFVRSGSEPVYGKERVCIANCTRMVRVHVRRGRCEGGGGGGWLNLPMCDASQVEPSHQHHSSFIFAYTFWWPSVHQCPLALISSSVF